MKKISVAILVLSLLVLAASVHASAGVKVGDYFCVADEPEHIGYSQNYCELVRGTASEIGWIKIINNVGDLRFGDEKILTNAGTITAKAVEKNRVRCEYTTTYPTYKCGTTCPTGAQFYMDKAEFVRLLHNNPKTVPVNPYRRDETAFKVQDTQTTIPSMQCIPTHPVAAVACTEAPTTTCQTTTGPSQIIVNVPAGKSVKVEITITDTSPATNP